MRGTLPVLLILTTSLCRAAPATSPATQPADASVHALIARLGDGNYRVRTAAEAQLKRLGAAALPALHDAAGDPDPEIQQRARALAMEIRSPAHAPSPGDGGAGVQRVVIGGRIIIVNGGQLIVNGAHVAVRIGAAGNGAMVRDVDVNDNGRTVHIHEGPDGLAMAVTERDGQFAQYRAANSDELKQKDPEAYQIYDKCTKDTANTDEGDGSILLPMQN
jgi:hypothetical protein